MKQLQIGPALAGDLPAVLALEQSVPSAPHWPDHVYFQLLNDLSRRFLVARRDEELIGYAVGQLVGDQAEVETLAVAEQHRGQGAGRALLRTLMDWCRDQGGVRIDLEVRENSAAARGLYLTCGFRETGRRAGYYADPYEAAVLMRWEPDNQAAIASKV